MPAYPSYFSQDLFSTLLAFCLFPVLVYSPGFVLCWLADLFGFRGGSFYFKSALAIIVSIACMPVVVFLAWRLVSYTLVLIFLSISLVLFLVIFFYTFQAGTLFHRSKISRQVLWAPLVWTLVCFFSLLDFQFGKLLYYPIEGFDLATRTTLTEAIARTGIPPVNPSYFPGYPVVITNLYYFWYILPAVIVKLGFGVISSHSAMIAGTAWAGLGLMALIAIYLKIYRSEGLDRKGRNIAFGLYSLLIGGLDIIPISIFLISERLIMGKLIFTGDIEHWNEQISMWVTSLLWVPNHLAALIACLLSVMILLYLGKLNIKYRIIYSVLAGFAIASGVGLSTYVTIVLFVFWVCWLGLLIFKRQFSEALWMVLAGGLALLLSIPFLMDLLRSPGLAGSFPLSFSIRTFFYVEPLVEGFSSLSKNLIFFLLLPLNYILELGFFLLAGVIWLRTYYFRTPNLPINAHAEVLLLGVTILLTSLVKSTVISNNDFGWRAWLPGQFILLIWGSDILSWYFENIQTDSIPFVIKTLDKKNPALALFLVIGLASTFLGAFSLRFWPMAIDMGWGISNLSMPETLVGERTFAARQTYEFIDSQLPANAIIQNNPAISIDIPQGLYSNHPAVLSGLTGFGIPPGVNTQYKNEIGAIFNLQNPFTWGSLASLCKQYHIDALVISDQDSAWNYFKMMSGTHPPLFENNHYLVLACPLITGNP